MLLLRKKKVTFFVQVNIIRIHEQFKLFKEYERRVRALIGEEETKKLVKKAIVLITLAGNDFVNNYFLTPVSARSLEFNIQDFSTYLISEYKNILLVFTNSFTRVCKHGTCLLRQLKQLNFY